MLLNLWKTHMLSFMFTLDGEGAPGGGSGQPSDELPANLVGKYISVEKHNSTLAGVKGANSQAIKAKDDSIAALTSEASGYKTELEQAKAKLTPLEAKAAEADAAKAKASELEVTLSAETGKNARMAELLKYPTLIDEATLALVTSSTLAPEALSKHLEALQGKFKGLPVAPASPTIPGSPPPAGEPQENTLVNQAAEAFRSGKVEDGNRLLNEAAAAHDKAGKGQKPLGRR